MSKVQAIPVYLGALISLLFFVDYLQAKEPPKGKATYEQCTCKLSGDDKKNGSNITNASLCVQSLDKNRDWCTVSVHCLDDGKTGPGCNEKEELTKIQKQAMTIKLGELLKSDKFINDLNSPLIRLFREHTSKPDTLIYEADADTIRTIVSKFGRPVLRCLQFFEKHEPFNLSEGSFGCEVTKQSKWLNLGFKLGTRTHVFQFAPSR